MSSKKSLLRVVSSLVAGVVFGVGLAVAEMTNPNKVLNFLDVTGTWDASLLFVLGAAVLLAAASFRWVLSHSSPLFDDKFHLPKAIKVDHRLISGAAIFGIGWGIAGYCPGPAVASLGLGNHEVLWLLPAMFIGAALQRSIDAAGRFKSPSNLQSLDV
jgi:uncharacterized membrane protein YedE/YeeE